MENSRRGHTGQINRVVRLSLALLALHVAAPAGPLSDRWISISITQGEHSRDSNSTTTEISIRGNALRFDKSYAGYRARKPVHTEGTLKAQDWERLKFLIESNKLMTARSVEYDTGEPGSYFTASIEITLQGTRSTIKISGMRKKLEDEAVYKGVMTLVDAIASIAEPDK